MRLEAKDGDYITLLVPADPGGVLDVEGRLPWLFKGSWDGADYFGEAAVAHSEVRLFWSDGEVMTIDLASAPMSVGRIFVVRSPSEGAYQYTVRDVATV